MTVFYGWTDIDDLKREFGITDQDLKEINILFAACESYCYEESAFVIFEKNAKLYEMIAYHCSCYGFEDSWEPEETTPDVILHRIENGKSYGLFETFQYEIKEVLNRYKGKQ